MRRWGLNPVNGGRVAELYSAPLLMQNMECMPKNIAHVPPVQNYTGPKSSHCIALGGLWGAPGGVLWVAAGGALGAAGRLWEAPEGLLGGSWRAPGGSWVAPGSPLGGPWEALGGPWGSSGRPLGGIRLGYPQV